MNGVLSRLNGFQFGRRSLAAAWALVFALAGLGSQAFADPPTINNLGVDLATYVPVVATALGLIIVACLAVYFGMMIINVGLRWVSSSFRRR